MDGSPATLRLTYVGHATLLIEMEGARVITDPVLGRRVGPLARIAERPDVAAFGKLDAILLSHLHIDHFDSPSLKRLDKATPVIVSRGGAKLVERRGFTTVTEVEAYDRVRVGPLEVMATPAKHAHKRHPLAKSQAGVGFMVSGGCEVYFAGDTGLFPEMTDLWDTIEVALLPVSGWGPTLDPDDHLGPEQAAEALKLLRPQVAVPVHWGTYVFPGVSLVRPQLGGEVAEEFARRAAQIAPEVEVRIIKPGGSAAFEFPRRPHAASTA